MATGLIVAVVLVFANGFFVGAEFAIARMRYTQAAELVRDRRPGAKSVQHAVVHIDAYLSACQLGITVSSLGLGAVGKPAFADLLEPLLGDSAEVVGFGLASIVAFSIITVAHVVLGELAPKSAAISRTVPVALLLAPPLRIFYLATKPVVDLFNFMGNLVLKPFGVPPASEAGHAPHSEDELRELLRASSKGGLIQDDEQQLSDAALVFGDLRAREVMQPRPDVDTVNAHDSASDAIETALRTGRTRLPLIVDDGGLDGAVGVINAKDLLRAALGEELGDLRELARPLPRVAEGTKVDEVLRDMRRDRRHLALVVDEHGTVTGLLTLEDVLEELVGEIDDEFDTEAEKLVTSDGGRVEMDGNAPVRLVARALGVQLDIPHEATISGHLIEALGRVPQAGETLEFEGVDVEVMAANDTHIDRLAGREPEATPEPEQ